MESLVYICVLYICVNVSVVLFRHEQDRTFCGYVSNVDICPFRHVTQDHEDDKPGEETCTAVYHTRYQRIPREMVELYRHMHQILHYISFNMHIARYTLPCI